MSNGNVDHGFYHRQMEKLKNLAQKINSLLERRESEDGEENEQEPELEDIMTENSDSQNLKK